MYLFRIVCSAPNGEELCGNSQVNPNLSLERFVYRFLELFQVKVQFEECELEQNHFSW